MCIKVKVSNMMVDIGMPPHLNGFLYLREAIMAVYEDVGKLNNLKGGLYCEIAKKYHTTTSRVERAMRNAIQVCLNDPNEVLVMELFGHFYQKEKHITNKQFISICAHRIVMAELADE